MKNTPIPWTQRPHNQPAGRGRYAIIKGKAYPSLLEGRHPTGEVHVSPADRVAFYNAPAVKLSEADLDDIEGANGAPLCFEHNPNDQVGVVTHSWVDTAQGRCLKIWGRVPLMDSHGNHIQRGHDIVAQIKAGRIRGLSVGYRTPLTQDPVTGTTKLSSKMFDEISLVEQPFFQGCDLTVGVFASGNSAGNLWKQTRFIS